MSEDLAARAARFDAAVEGFVDLVAEDRTVLAVVRLGSGRPDTLWNSDHVHLQVVVADGTRPRRRADGDEPRLFRTWVEGDVDLHAELIERTRFQRMIEGHDRNHAGFSWFAEHTLVHCVDPSVERWFAAAHSPAAKDQRHEQLGIACWIADTLRRTRRRLQLSGRLHEAVGDAMELAFAVACLAVVDEGDVVENRILDHARAARPALMKALWDDVMADPSPVTLRAACDAAEAHLDGRWEALMDPVLRYLDRVGAPVALSELAEHFATSALRPGTLAAACAWMAATGRLTRLSVPTTVTRSSRVQVEEPAYTRS